MPGDSSISEFLSKMTLIVFAPICYKLRSFISHQTLVQHRSLSKLSFAGRLLRNMQYARRGNCRDFREANLGAFSFNCILQALTDFKASRRNLACPRWHTECTVTSHIIMKGMILKRSMDHDRILHYLSAPGYSFKNVGFHKSIETGRNRLGYHILLLQRFVALIKNISQLKPAQNCALHESISL